MSSLGRKSLFAGHIEWKRDNDAGRGYVSAKAKCQVLEKHNVEMSTWGLSGLALDD